MTQFSHRRIHGVVSPGWGLSAKCMRTQACALRVFKIHFYLIFILSFNVLLLIWVEGIAKLFPSLIGWPLVFWLDDYRVANRTPYLLIQVVKFSSFIGFYIVRKFFSSLALATIL